MRQTILQNDLLRVSWTTKNQLRNITETWLGGTHTKQEIQWDTQIRNRRNWSGQEKYVSWKRTRVCAMPYSYPQCPCPECLSNLHSALLLDNGCHKKLYSYNMPHQLVGWAYVCFLSHLHPDQRPVVNIGIDRRRSTKRSVGKHHRALKHFMMLSTSSKSTSNLVSLAR